MTEVLSIESAAPAFGSFAPDAIALLVGWGLGILSSPITDSIRRHSAKRRLTRAVRTELASLQDSLAGAVVQISRRHRVLTPSLLEALMTTLRSSGREAAGGKTLKAIDGLLELDERALAASQGTTEPRTNPRDMLSLKVSGAPFLDSHLNRLDLYSPETQRMLVEIRSGLQLFDQNANEAMHYHFMTFASGIEQQHLAALESNVERCFERAADRASDLVSRIAVVLQNHEMHTGWSMPRLAGRVQGG